MGNDPVLKVIEVGRGGHSQSGEEKHGEEEAATIGKDCAECSPCHRECSVVEEGKKGGQWEIANRKPCHVDETVGVIGISLFLQHQKPDQCVVEIPDAETCLGECGAFACEEDKGGHEQLVNRDIEGERRVSCLQDFETSFPFQCGEGVDA